MFFCDSCRQRNRWPESMSRSSGRCEVCGKTAVCFDVPSSALPLPTQTTPPPALKRGTRFRAYPSRKVRYGSGPWIERPVYVVTSVRTHGPSKVIYYRCEASPDKRAEDYATVEYLFGNGLEILPAAPKED